MKRLGYYLVATLFSLGLSLSSYARTVVVIDAGHGGKDPGATGISGVKEKGITLAISKELKALLDADSNFKAVMTRSTDKFILLPERTEIARKNKANYLVSIHADSSPISSNMKGASVWVLSNRRASDEMGKWLEDHEKQSELLGGAGSVLSHSNERYLNQTVLDLQFSHSQRSGYELGRAVLSKLSNAVTVSKSNPQHASLSVLRSPDITSILVETGYLSNPTEERLLSTSAYQRKIARAIYNGLVAYRTKNNPTSSSVKYVEKESKLTEKKEETQENKKEKVEKKENAETAKRPEPKKSNTGYHVVMQDETLYSIARVYGTTPEKLSQLNNIKNNNIVVGKKLKIR